MKALFAFAALAFSLSASAMSPPWIITQEYLKHTLGANPCITVGEPESMADHSWSITLKTCDNCTAQGLALVLKDKLNDDDLTSFQVVNADSVPVPRIDPSRVPTIEELQTAYESVLGKNPYFAGFKAGSLLAIGFLEFKPEIIQIFTDNLMDAYGLDNLVAADAFSQVLKLEFDKYVVGVTSTPKNAPSARGDK